MPRRRVAQTSLGYALGAAFGPMTLGLSPDQGHSPGIFWACIGGAEPPPHIRRQSRSHTNVGLLGQANTIASGRIRKSTRCLLSDMAWNGGQMKTIKMV